MSTFLGQALATFGLTFALGIGAGLSQDTALSQSPCGQLIRWKLPETMVVERTPGDTRSAGVLMTQARLDAIIVAAEAYCRLSNGSYPRTFEDMVIGLPGMTNCTLDTMDVKDAWDQPIFYAPSGDRPMLESAGADGRFTTTDDIGWPNTSDIHVESFDLSRECGGS